jgi:hypothetical protein
LEFEIDENEHHNECEEEILVRHASILAINNSQAKGSKGQVINEGKEV